jgi:pimeloyl-ACP methyl ester carboxylesterase
MTVALIIVFFVSFLIIDVLIFSIIGTKKAWKIYNNFLANPPQFGKLLQSKDVKVFGRVKGQGKHTIVIESGSGSNCAEWFGIQDNLSQHAKVVVYNRPGYPWSEHIKEKRNPKNIANELRQMLENEGLEPPFIIVGHSFGGMVANAFARLFPEATQAVVFIDATHPEHRRFEDLGGNSIMMSISGKISKMKFFKTMSNLGFLAFFTKPIKVYVEMTLPNAESEIKNAVSYGYKAYGSFDAITDELESIMESNIQFQLLPQFPNIPLRIIYHNPQKNIDQMVQYKLPQNDAEAIEKLWQELDESFLIYSSKSKRVVSNKATHLINTDDSELIEKEIIDLMENL